MKRQHKFRYLILALLIVAATIFFSVPKKSTKETIVKKRPSTSNTQSPEVVNIDTNPNIILPSKVLLEVPFTTQSPFAQWSDPQQNNACEEASLVMAAHWLSKEPLSKESADSEIRSLINFEMENYNEAIDASAADTKKLFQEYYSKKVFLTYDITIDEIIAELGSGNLVIVPVDGIALQNPNFRQPGPERHMLVIKGFNSDKNEFITNEPGTRHGDGYTYSYEKLFAAIRDYPTGDHLPIVGTRKAMLVIPPQ